MNKIFLFLFAAILFVACKKEQTEVTSELEGPDTEVIEKPLEDIGEKVDKESTTIEKSTREIKEELNAKGFKTFDYVDEKTQDTIIMQQYFMAFLKSGPIRSQNEEEAARLQKEHLAHLSKMYELGYADISGPFGDNGEIRGITIYNVPTIEMADSLANSDPMVKAGRLVIEVHPWWAAKGFPLR
ncbi:hypothetical protein RXV94_01305 [Yeosuana sp. MJ-SS3]|uniref:YCII-related domain-containing protein n=1 Tax=Gilvirhabdus luticola TaxID=3079858 RepID=A0ABU3U2Y8_9FLAO|nr:YciI family protein [Yeosuana sp. MJ-SS3]MDU8884776.1 hypothetical protein [Yeosuana sp. MJ-SS3]